MVRHHAQQAKGSFLEPFPGEDGKHTEHPVPADERLPGKTDDVLPPDPGRIGYPSGFGIDFDYLDRLSFPGDLAHLADAEGKAAEGRSGDGIPGCVIDDGAAVAGHQVQATFPVRAKGGVSTLRTSARRLQEPDPDQGHIRRTSQRGDCDIQHFFHSLVLGKL